MVTSGRAELSCATAGEGGVVLLLHAGVADSRSWAALVDRLAATQRTVAYDRRGFGESVWEPEPHSHVDDAAAVLAAVGAARAAIVGASMGGRVALDLALSRPRLVTSLVLVAPAVRGAPADDELPAPVQALSDAIDAAEAAGDVAAVNRLEAHLWLDGPAAPEGRVQGAARDLFLDMNGIALNAGDPGPELDLRPAWDRLEEIGVPTLVVAGDLDLPDTVERCRVVADRIPDARFELITGVAHLPQLEADRTFLEVVHEFLREQDARAAR
jgi:pimeloyl-ACP methyl ester carboxylesterase